MGILQKLLLGIPQKFFYFDKCSKSSLWETFGTDGIPSGFSSGILRQFLERSLDRIPGSFAKFLFQSENYSSQTKLHNSLMEFSKYFLEIISKESIKHSMGIHRRHIKEEPLAEINEQNPILHFLE